MASLTMRNVRKSFGRVEIIKGVDLDIGDGEFVVFVGPSGCGKSTLLRMVAGLEEITSGDILIDDKLCNDIAPKDRGIAMVFQSYALYPHKSVYANMAFALEIAGFSKAEIAEKVAKAAKILHIEHLLDRKPGQLSGGQRQRVAIGRAIVREPKIFLFDEPLSNLDAALRVSTRAEIAKLHEDLGSTMVYVTHDQVEAMTLADKIVVLRAGVIEQVGAPLDLYDNPANTFVAGFIGSPRMNFFEGTVRGADGARCLVELQAFDGAVVAIPLKGALPAVGAQVSLGVRPEHFHDDGDGHLRLTIDMLEHLGGETFAYARSAAGAMVVVETRHGRALQSGQNYDARFHTASALLFDKAGQRIY